MGQAFSVTDWVDFMEETECFDLPHQKSKPEDTTTILLSGGEFALMSILDWDAVLKNIGPEESEGGSAWYEVYGQEVGGGSR